jgi:hypothetical protein
MKRASITINGVRFTGVYWQSPIIPWPDIFNDTPMNYLVDNPKPGAKSEIL